MLSVYFLSRFAYNTVAQVDEDKTDMVFICSQEKTDNDNTACSTTYIAQNRGGGGEGVTTETLLLNHALFLSLFLPFSVHFFFLLHLSFSSHFSSLPSFCSLHSLLSVTGWKQKRDKETPKPIQGVVVEHPGRLVIDMFVS